MRSFFSQIVGGFAIIVIAGLCGVIVNAFRPNGVPLIQSGAPVSTVQRGAAAPADTAATDTTKVAQGAISLAEMKRRFDAGTSKIIDARDPDDFKAGHIPGAINIPYDKIPQYFDTLNSQVPPDADVIVYCHGPKCDFADKLATELKLMDYQHVSVFSGGWDQWSMSGYPIEGATPK